MDNKVPKLDNIDLKMLTELDNNSKVPITKLAKKLRISREVAKYRINRLVTLGIIKRFTTMINPAKFNLIIYKIYLKLQSLSAEKEKELFDYLKKSKKVFWLAKTNGAFDLIAGLYVKNVMEFNNFLLEFTGEFGKQILSRHFSNSVYSTPFKKKYLVKQDNLEVFWGGVPEEIAIDDLMKDILKVMAEDSRIPIAKICEDLHTTPKTVISKIRYMEKNKIILGYRIILNLEKLNKENYKALIYFRNASPENEHKFHEFCKHNPSITYYIKTIGEWDAEIDIEIDNYREFNKLL